MKRGKFQNFQKSRGSIIPKIVQTKTQWTRDIVATSVFFVGFHRHVDRLRIDTEVTCYIKEV